MSFPNLIDDILLTLKRRGLTDLLAQALPDKRRDNSHIPFDILLCQNKRMNRYSLIAIQLFGEFVNGI